MPERIPRGKRIVNFEGEAMTIELIRREPDTSLRGQIWNACCDCNLYHLLVFEVFQDGRKNWYLNKRTWRLPQEVARDAVKKRRKK